MAAVPIMAQLSQAGVGRMLNMDAFIEDFLIAFGIEDTERYFVSAPAPASPPAGGGGPGAPAGPEGPGGVTAPQASDSSSPSSQVSLSPEVLLQRAMASRGGAVNS